MPRSRKCGSLHPPPIRFHGVVLRDNFTFTLPCYYRRKVFLRYAVEGGSCGTPCVPRPWVQVRLQCWHYSGEGFLKYASGIVYIPHFMTFDSCIKVLVMLMLASTSTIWGAALLVLLMGGIYEVHRQDGRMIHMPTFMTISSGIHVILRLPREL
jgi:hypothetical protein